MSSDARVNTIIKWLHILLTLCEPLGEKLSTLFLFDRMLTEKKIIQMSLFSWEIKKKKETSLAVNPNVFKCVVDGRHDVQTFLLDVLKMQNAIFSRLN